MIVLLLFENCYQKLFILIRYRYHEIKKVVTFEVKNMACFIVPMSLAIVVGIIRKNIPAAYHINWLLMLLGGGVTALVVDHVAQGEIIPYPPFLTALSSSAGIAAMVQEMATIGVAMAAICVMVWIALIVYVSRMKQRSENRASP
jgi:putative effector of murein hydrolase LrgA (UPF0299 family)